MAPFFLQDPKYDLDYTLEDGLEAYPGAILFKAAFDKPLLSDDGYFVDIFSSSESAEGAPMNNTGVKKSIFSVRVILSRKTSRQDAF
jgi:hypothetical protein